MAEEVPPTVLQLRPSMSANLTCVVVKFNEACGKFVNEVRAPEPLSNGDARLLAVLR